MVEGTAMSERENILTRVREALSRKTQGQGGSPTVADLRRVLPTVEATPAGQLALFQKNAAELRADFHLVPDWESLKLHLRSLCETEGWRKVAAHKGQFSQTAAESLGVEVLLTGDGFDKNELEAIPVGITECDALVAQTGSVLVTSRSAGGRALSCLPPHHVVIARQDQLVADLPAAMELLQRKYGANYPSMISFITGPSRTGDIERILVLGAHGPKKLTLYLVANT